MYTFLRVWLFGWGFQRQWRMENGDVETQLDFGWRRMFKYYSITEKSFAIRVQLDGSLGHICACALVKALGCKTNASLYNPSVWF